MCNWRLRDDLEVVIMKVIYAVIIRRVFYIDSNRREIQVANCGHISSVANTVTFEVFAQTHFWCHADFNLAQ